MTSASTRRIPSKQPRAISLEGKLRLEIKAGARLDTADAFSAKRSVRRRTARQVSASLWTMPAENGHARRPQQQSKISKGKHYVRHRAWPHNAWRWDGALLPPPRQCQSLESAGSLLDYESGASWREAKLACRNSAAVVGLRPRSFSRSPVWPSHSPALMPCTHASMKPAAGSGSPAAINTAM